MMKHHFFLFVKLWIILFVVISAASIWMHRHTFGFRLSKGLLEIFQPFQNFRLCGRAV